MNQTSIQQKCVGIAIVVVIVDGSGAPVDLTDATDVTFIFKSPVSGTPKITKTGSIDSPPTSGSVRYVTTTGDLEDVGTWKFQVRAQFSGTGEDIWSKIGNINVLANL